MRIGVFPGSFDPLTSGHYDLIERAAALVDCLYVAVLKNSDKTPLFTLKQRKEMIESATALLPNVKVEAFEGLLVDFARQKGASVLFRGLRNDVGDSQPPLGAGDTDSMPFFKAGMDFSVQQHRQGDAAVWAGY